MRLQRVGIDGKCTADDRLFQLCLNRTRAAFEFKKIKFFFCFFFFLLLKSTFFKICPVSTAICVFRHPCIINVWTIENI